MSDEVIATPFGKFLISPEDLIGSTLKAGTVWDGPGFLQVLARDHALSQPEKTVIDVGANQGAWTIWLAGQGIRVIAVEPVPEVVSRLKANLDLNRDRHPGTLASGWQGGCADRVIVVPYAAYSRPVLLRLPPLDATNLGGTALTPQLTAACARVDAMVLDNLQPLWNQHGVSLIKIDTQGCDGAVIYGLEQTIERWHPTIVFEWEEELAKPHGHTLAGVAAFITSRQYDLIRWPSHPDNYVAIWRGQTS